MSDEINLGTLWYIDCEDCFQFEKCTYKNEHSGFAKSVKVSHDQELNAVKFTLLIKDCNREHYFYCKNGRL